MYRVLRDHDEVRERRRQATHPAAKKPELLATKPNEVYSWDITKLLGPAKWTYYYLYVILDIYSRYVPGWMLAHAENARLAEALLADTVTKQHIEPRPADHPRRPRLADGLQARRLPARRPRRHQEPQPARTCATTTRSARASSAPSSTGPSSPTASAASRTPTPSAAGSSAGTTTSIATPASGSTPPPTSTTAGPKRSATSEPIVLNAAYAAHPERFVRKPPQPPALPTAVWINEPKEDPATTQ